MTIACTLPSFIAISRHQLYPSKQTPTSAIGEVILIKIPGNHGNSFLLCKVEFYLSGPYKGDFQGDFIIHSIPVPKS